MAEGFKKRKKITRRGKSKKAFQLKLKPQTVYSIAQILFFSLAGIIIISFSRQGLILMKFNTLLMDYFAWSAIFLPFIFLSFGFLLSKYKRPLGQPNVVVGGLLLFISLLVLGRSGIVGKNAWEGMETLLTVPGSIIILLGVILVGFVVLFNTSFDQLLTLFVLFLKQVRRYLVGEKELAKLGSNPKLAMGRRDLKIGGMVSSNSPMMANPPLNSGMPKKEEPIASQIVSNLPGDQQIWKYPTTELLSDASGGHADRGDIRGNAAIIEQTLESFGITAHVVEVNQGPAVTQYALEVALGTKLSKILTLERDLARALASPNGSIRIEAPIAGRSLVGIELPNRSPEFVPMKKIMESEVMVNAQSKLTVALGLDVAGKPVVANIAKMPHVLIAGQTGSGKSVCLNTFLATLLFRASPSEVKLILVDPKRVELTGYNNIPHLLAPVIVEPEKVVSALKWVMGEMDRRYKLFAQAGVRNIEGYNEMSGFQALPYIVLVIDELADIMLFSPVEVEDCITRIAQMSRATGIHMVLATQRPSVDVITGLIKANIPFRIAFAVSSLVDSRVILDTQGAEKLLGKGDMLYLSADQAKPSRVQGAFVSDKEINALVAFIKNQGVAPQYTEEVTAQPSTVGGGGINGGGSHDDFFAEAVRIVCQYDKASASLLQRRLSVGYARAARIVDQLESAGVISPSDGSAKPRQVLVRNAEEFLANENNRQIS